MPTNSRIESTTPLSRAKRVDEHYHNRQSENLHPNSVVCTALHLNVLVLLKCFPPDRGAMASSAIKQLLNDVEWGELDFLIIDLPPGTGDIQLSLCQTLKISGAVIVSTPQEISLLDVRKAINMFKKVNVPILGTIQNMSFIELNKKKSYLFGKDGVIKESEKQKQIETALPHQFPNCVASPLSHRLA